MRIKNFSWASFFIGGGVGLVLGAIVLGLFVNYLITRALSSESTDGFILGGAVNQVREGINTVKGEKERTSAYGKVVSIQNGTLIIQVANSQGPTQYTFRYDDNTKFVSLANDSASTEIPLSTDTIEVGTGLNVYTNEAMGSVSNQYAVKVIKL